MSRKNIFQLVEENYDVQDEIRTINCLFFTAPYFYNALYQTQCTFESLLDKYLFINWKWRDTCLTVIKFFVRAKAYIDYKDIQTKITEDVVINNIEVIENFLYLYSNNADRLSMQYFEECNADFSNVFVTLIKKIENKMGLVTKKFKDRIIVFPKNAPLEKVVNLCNDEDIQWELIRYAREELSLSEKRKSLAYLATNLYIEQDKKETNSMLIDLLDQATNVLNNLHIRHNNKTGKWEKNDIINNISDKEAKQLCDFVFNKMLIIVLLRENEKYEATYQKFNNIQKGGKKANEKT